MKQAGWILVLMMTTSVQAGPTVLTAACESALARSALPERLRANTSVVGLTESGYQRLASGSAPFTCIVERNHPDALIPQCVDAAGADTIIPALIWKSEQALSGRMDIEQINLEFARLVEQGRFKAPARPGLSYMVSNLNYIYIAGRKKISHVHPHMMFYAPGLDNADIGGSFEAARENRGLPFVLDSGIHGYMISFVENPSSSDQVTAECAGQLDEARLTSR